MARTPERPGPTRADEDVPAAGIRGEQHTWNHEERPQYEKEGNEAFGGTRKGAENVEPEAPEGDGGNGA